MSGRCIEGYVVSSSGNTATVLQIIEKKVYGRPVKFSRKRLVHDPDRRCKNGSKVRIVQCSPVSKRKSFIVQEVF